MTPSPCDLHDIDVTTSTSNAPSLDTVKEHFMVTTSIPLQQHMAILNLHNPESATIAPTATTVYSTEVSIGHKTTPEPSLSPQLPPIINSDQVHACKKDTTPLLTMADVSHEWLQDMGLGNPGTKLLCHPMYKQLVLNGVTFDYIPACGLPTGFMDETMQDQTQSQGKQPLVSAQNGTEVQNYYSVDDEPVAHVMADKFSLINTDCGTSSTKAIIKHSSTATLVGNRVSSPSSTKAADVVTESVITMDQDIATDPSSATIQEAATTTSISTNNTNETDSIIQSSKPAPSVRATHIIELSDDEDDLEVTTVIPSKRQLQEDTSGGLKDSQTETNIHPKPHSQGTWNFPLEIESDSDSELSPFSGTSF